MKRLAILGLAVLVVALLGGAALGGIVYKSGGYIAGSKHDFRASTTYTNLANSLTPGYAAELGPEFVPAGAEICRACHVPHNAVEAFRIWTRDYVDESGLSLAITDEKGTVESSSTLCMQCHDGTIAFGGTPPVADVIANASNLGADLSNDHPVNAQCDWAAVKVDAATSGSHGPYITIYGQQVVAEPSSHNQGSSPIDLVYTVAADGSGHGYITCSSCHNVHGMNQVDTVTGTSKKVAKFLVMDNTGSALCQACHGK